MIGPLTRLLPLLVFLSGIVAGMLSGMPFPLHEAHAGPSFRTLQVVPPDTATWRDGIILSLVIDEVQCRRTYGSNWPQECLTPPLGEQGARVRNMKMTPHVPGEWRWTGPQTMQFTPAPQAALRPATSYELDVREVPLPPRVQLKSSRIHYTTQPQAVWIGKENIWIDPSKDESHGLSIPLRFIWPVKAGELEQILRLEPARGSGLRFGDVRYAWNADRDSVVLSAAIQRLPEQDSRMQLSVAGLPSYSEEHGRRTIAAEDRGARHAFGVPGRGNLLFFRNITLTRGHDKALNARYELELQTSLRIDPAQLGRHLRLLELPEKAQPGADRPTDWTRLPALDLRDVTGSREIVPELLTGSEPTETIRYRLPIRPGRCVLVFVSRELSALSGVRLNRDMAKVLQAPEMDAELSFLLPGNLINLSGSLKIALHSIGIDSLRWKARHIRTPFLALFAASHGFSTQTLEPWMPETDLDAQTLTRTGTLPVALLPDGEASFPVLDLTRIMTDLDGGCGLYQLELEGLRDNKSVVQAQRLFLLTRMGLTIKENADGGRHVFVESLLSGTPVSGARVQLLAKNGTVLAQEVTNASGQAYLTPTRGLEGELEPVALIAQSQGREPDLSWISLRDTSRILDNGDFAVLGRHGTESGLLASVFSQRGLYMPGDTLHFGILVRRFDWQALPADLPLEAVLSDPLGRTVFTQRLTGDVSLCETSWTSAPSSPTGPYRLEVRLGQDKGPVLGSTTVRLEEFQPDSLALAARLEPEVPAGWIRTRHRDTPARARVSLRTLYGEPAAHHDIRASLQVSPASLHFARYQGYTFHDPSLPVREPRTIALPDVQTDERGEATLVLPADTMAGTCRGTLQIEGFEASGGRAVARQISALFSPLDVLVGYKPDGEANTLGHLQQNARASLHILALDNTLAPARLENVLCTVSSRRYINALVRDDRGEFRYDATPVTSPVNSRTVTIDHGGLSLPLSTAKPGDYVLTLTKDNGEPLLSVPYTVAGRTVVLADGTSTVPLADAQLRLELARTDYEPGDTILVRMNVPYSGTGLITIERENVVASSWFRAEAGESEQRIRIPQTFEGQGYVSVLFSRTSNSEAIYIKPHAYASVPFNCGFQRRSMGLNMEAPESVLPGKTLTVQLKSRKPGRVLLFAVDEGILSLTGFTSPNPLQDLLSNRALDVVTRQAFDLLMPDFARLKNRLPAFGGDMANPGGRFLNPFRRRNEPPFAHWSGLVTVGPEGTAVDIPVPEYLSGRIRLMAVGSSSSRGDFLTAGSAEATCTVRGTLLLRPHLPLAVSPGDVFHGAVSVANTIAGSGRAVPVRLTLAADPGLRLAGTTAESSFQQILTLDENAEAVVPFTIAVSDRPGSASVHFTAELVASGEKEAGTWSATRQQSLSIRPLSVCADSLQSGPLGRTTEITVERSLYPFEAETTLTVTSAPVAAFRSLAARLADYPFGCTEQQISRAFPWLAALQAPRAASVLFAATGLDARKIGELGEEGIAKAVATMRSTLTPAGLSLWPGGESNDFVTALGADFLVSLAERGHGVPADLRGQILNRLQSVVWRDPVRMEDARIKAYACWVLLRAGTVVTQDVERLHAWLDGQAQAWQKDVTASLLADCYAMLRLNDLARRLLPLEISPLPSAANCFFNGPCAQALQATILAQPHWQHVLDKADPAALKAARTRALDEALQAAVSTTAMALTSRALTTVLVLPESAQQPPAHPDKTGSISMRCTQYGEGFAGAAERLSLPLLEELSAPGCLRFEVRGEGAEGLSWQVHQRGYDRTKARDSASHLEVTRRYLDAEGRAVTSVREGDVLTVELGIRADRPLENVALVDLLPGGLEPLLDTENGWQGGLIQHRERHEDRMFFFVAPTQDLQLATYRVRAVTAGTFQVPALHAEAMYDPGIHASLHGSPLTVTGRQAQGADTTPASRQE